MPFFVVFSLFFSSKIYQPLVQRALPNLLRLGGDADPPEFYTALLHPSLLAPSAPYPWPSAARGEPIPDPLTCSRLLDKGCSRGALRSSVARGTRAMLPSCTQGCTAKPPNVCGRGKANTGKTGRGTILMPAGICGRASASPSQASLKFYKSTDTPVSREHPSSPLSKRAPEEPRS